STEESEARTPYPTTEDGPTPAPSKAEDTPAPTRQESGYPTPAPSKTAEESTSCTEVSVEGDATYCIQGPVCSGSDDEPAGSQCPVKGDVATKDCIETIPSWTSASSCVAPMDAECGRVSSGAWGCKFGQTEAGSYPTPAPTYVNITPAPSTSYVTEGAPVPTSIAATPSPTTAYPEAPSPTPTTPYVPDAPSPTPYPSTVNTDAPPSNPEVPATTPSESAANPTTPTPQPTVPDVPPQTDTPFQPSDAPTSAPQPAQQLSTSTATAGETATGATSMSVGGVAAIVAGVGAIVAIAGFAAYKHRQKLASRNEFESSIMTPVPSPA
ncbi:hypothetical protein F443_16253, partial [Phytophthora nicotianae P1569]